MKQALHAGQARRVLVRQNARRWAKSGVYMQAMKHQNRLMLGRFDEAHAQETTTIRPSESDGSSCVTAAAVPSLRTSKSEKQEVEASDSPPHSCEEESSDAECGSASWHAALALRELAHMTSKAKSKRLVRQNAFRVRIVQDDVQKLHPWPAVHSEE